MDMPLKRLQENLGRYISDTLSYIQTTEDFIGFGEKWFINRKEDITMMKAIIDRANALSFDHNKKSQGTAKAVGQYLKSGLTSDRIRQELEKELGRVLADLCECLRRQLHYFLEAVEKLAVTSFSVFPDDRYLPKGVSGAAVRSVITAARMSAPLLVHFKRDDTAFFLPSLSNLEVLILYLERYVNVTKQLCEKLGNRQPGISNVQVQVKLSEEGLSEKSIDIMLEHLSQLSIMRKDQDFRLTFLFQEDAAESFIGLFNERHSRMRKFLLDLEDNAIQLDNMRFGADVSSVAGSIVGVASGVTSIVGLALIPFTAGASSVLTITGISLGITSGANSLVTGLTELAVNKTCGDAANGIFQSFVEDVNTFTYCLNTVASREVNVDCRVSSTDLPSFSPDEAEIAVGVGQSVKRACVIGKGIDNLVDAAAAYKALQPDKGQTVAKGPLALSKAARSGLIAANALFIGLDVFFICKGSISLSKGSKSEVAQLIRSRSTLWRSELDSWERIHDSLRRGKGDFVDNQKVLKQSFYI